MLQATCHGYGPEAMAMGQRPWLWATGHGYRAAGPQGRRAAGPQGKGHRPQGKGHRPKATGQRPQGKGHRAKATGQRPQGKGHRPRRSRPQTTELYRRGRSSGLGAGWGIRPWSGVGYRGLERGRVHCHPCHVRLPVIVMPRHQPSRCCVLKPRPK